MIFDHLTRVNFENFWNFIFENSNRLNKIKIKCENFISIACSYSSIMSYDLSCKILQYSVYV